jgi:hypothetical protein
MYQLKSLKTNKDKHRKPSVGADKVNIFNNYIKGLKQDNGLAVLLFNLAFKFIIRRVSTDLKRMIMQIHSYHCYYLLVLDRHD